jgi:DNA-binding CsgD family transcriptional regulator/tetratricopeptide (TPR) repeat protein
MSLRLRRGLTRVHAPPTALIGRDADSKALFARIDAAREGRGGALVLRGAPGIGKTSLLEVARAHAATSGLHVLSTTGVQSETHLPFAGLHQLLRPVLHDVDRLPMSYAKAVQGAFGLHDEPVSGPYVVAMAVLHLLGESAERAPLVLLVDDAQWLDGSTGAALAFVARRLESDSIALIVAIRDGFATPFLEAGILERAIDALTDAHSEALLDSSSPGLGASLRERVLRNAAGNPLALLELVAALRSKPEVDPAAADSELPLTDRLEYAFADRLTSLSPGARSFLRVAAANDSGVIAEALAAATTLDGRPVSLAVATEAKEARFVEVEGHGHLRFRHPLMRSAILRAMTLEERRETHAALAATLVGDADRRTWHRASAVLETDASIAADLEELARRAHRRGAAGVAIQALDRAAQLANDSESRGRHLARAAVLAMILGRASSVLQFLDTVDDGHVPPGERPSIVTMRESFGRSAWSGASRIPEFVEIADRLGAGGEVERATAALYVIANRCWWSNPDEAVRREVVAVLERFPDAPEDPRRLATLALASPVEHGSIVLERLARRSAEHPAERGSLGDYQLGLAALSVGDFARAERSFEARVQFNRAQGLLGGLVSSLLRLSWVKIHLGDWRKALSITAEAERLGGETGQLDLAAGATLAGATIAAYRGEVEVAERLSAAGERGMIGSYADPGRAMARWSWGVAAFVSGRHEEAYRQLRRVYDPKDDSYHPHMRSWLLVDLVEAAVHCGQEDDANSIVRDLEPIVARARWPVLVASLQYAHAVLASDNNEKAFRADAELATWPFMRARLQLAYGVWLRRQRRVADSRAPLRAARDAFDALGAAPWGERARQELRASGETSRRRSYDLTDALSPQELQIAQMAAAGLSNKEIGQQLFLSHRTISTHLYRTFPKLGITARSHLSSALQRRSTAQAS